VGLEGPGCQVAEQCFTVDEGSVAAVREISLSGGCRLPQCCEARFVLGFLLPRQTQTVLCIGWFDHGTDEAFGFLALRMDSA
jgi:hypothetical protein